MNPLIGLFAIECEKRGSPSDHPKTTKFIPATVRTSNCEAWMKRPDIKLENDIRNNVLRSLLQVFHQE